MALKDFIKNLPLDSISEHLAKVVFWWINLIKDVPEDKLPLYAYVGGSVLVLLLLLVVLRIFPRMIRGVIWIISAAILLTPGDTLGGHGDIAPAIIGVLHGLLMGQYDKAMSGMMSILGVIVAGLMIGAVWQLLRALIAAMIARRQEELGEHG